MLKLKIIKNIIKYNYKLRHGSCKIFCLFLKAASYLGKRWGNFIHYCIITHSVSYNGFLASNTQTGHKVLHYSDQFQESVKINMFSLWTLSNTNTYILFSMQQSKCQDMCGHKLRQAGWTMHILIVRSHKKKKV